MDRWDNIADAMSACAFSMTGAEVGGLTILSDGGRAPDDERGLAGILGGTTLLPGSREVDGARLGVVTPDRADGGGEPERDGRSLIKSDVIRNLNGHATFPISDYLDRLVE